MQTRARSLSRLAGNLASLAGMMVIALAPRSAGAQAVPAAGPAHPDDAPSVKIGAVIFADYTFQQKPSVTDADGNSVKSNAFNVSRSYINVTGSLSHLVAFRVTPDIVRNTDSGSSLNGSLTFRLKYAFAQFNLDDWMPKGTWIRFGIHPTPFVDLVEGVYRYRFQGTMFPEREGYISSADAGVSFRTAFPGNHGDVQAGLYNGENYNKAEANDQKAVMIRGTLRPLPTHPLLRGWRLTGFYIGDHYMRNSEKKRGILNATFEHKYVNAGFDYLVTRDQASAKVGTKNLHGKGWSVFVTPRLPHAANGSSWELFLRYDRMQPNDEVAVVGGPTAPGVGTNTRAIVGVAYWFPKQGSVSSALLCDVENLKQAGYAPARPDQQRLFLHGLISF